MNGGVYSVFCLTRWRYPSNFNQQILLEHENTLNMKLQHSKNWISATPSNVFIRIFNTVLNVVSESKESDSKVGYASFYHLG